MRFLTAVILFVISAVLVLTGIAQRTIWHPPASYEQTIHLPSGSSLEYVHNGVFRQHPGSAVVTADSGTFSFLAVGRGADIHEWIGGTKHLEVDLKNRQGVRQPVASLVKGNVESANPAGSDLWRHETSAVGAVSTVVNADDSAGLLVASNGFNQAPTVLHLKWPIVFNPTPSAVLIILGGIFLLAAVVVNWWAWYQMRKARGPRRKTPRAPQGPKTRRRRLGKTAPAKGRRSARNFTSLVAGGLVLASLAGCAQSNASASGSPNASQASNSVVVQPPVVETGQLERIIRQVADVVAQGDSAQDAKLLKSRVVGPALESRKAYYALQKTSKSVPALPPIATSQLKLVLPAASNLWPRTVMAITSSGSASALPQMLVLQQQTPRSQYQLWYNINMLPGVKLPILNTAQVGAIPVAADSLFLKIAPNAIPNAFGDLIDNGPASLSANMFNVTNDEYYQQISQSLKAQLALTSAKVKVVHLLGDPNVMSLSTLDSGALVAVWMQDKYVIKPTVVNQAVSVSGNEKLLLGSSGSTKGIKSFYGTMLLFYVPGIASKDKILTLGASQFLMSVASM